MSKEQSGLTRREFLGAAAMSEPDVGSDLGNIACRARKDGDGWLIKIRLGDPAEVASLLDVEAYRKLLEEQ